MQSHNYSKCLRISAKFGLMNVKPKKLTIILCCEVVRGMLKSEIICTGQDSALGVAGLVQTNRSLLYFALGPKLLPSNQKLS